MLETGPESRINKEKLGSAFNQKSEINLSNGGNHVEIIFKYFNFPLERFLTESRQRFICRASSLADYLREEIIDKFIAFALLRIKLSNFSIFLHFIRFEKEFPPTDDIHIS